MTDDSRRLDLVRAMLDQLDETIRTAESVRAHIERALKRPAFWPDRRHPRHWTQNDVTSREDRDPEER